MDCSSLHVVFFTSFPAYNLVGTQQNKKGMKIRYYFFCSSGSSLGTVLIAI